jgi:hypothetical protein
MIEISRLKRGIAMAEERDEMKSIPCLALPPESIRLLGHLLGTHPHPGRKRGGTDLTP